MSSENMEKDIKSLVDAALLKRMDSGSELEADKELFISTLRKYSVLRQIPKFFVKLLLGVVEVVKNCSKGLKKGQIETSVLQACSECIRELPPGQTFELWEIFVETFNTLRKIVLSSPTLFGALFYVCQLFQTFLLHARLFDALLPTNTLSKREAMVQLTDENLKEMSSILKETNPEVIPLQFCLLIICYAIGEVKIAHNLTSSTTEFTVPNFQVQVLDFSLLHAYFNDHIATVFSSYLESEDKSRLCYLIQILIQKVRLLIMKQNSVQNIESNLQSSIAFVIKIMASLGSDVNGIWNRNLSTLDVSNYGTALWDSFLKFLPLISVFLNNKQASIICDSMIDVLLVTSEKLNNKNESDARSLILYFLKSNFFKESTILQTALISSIWKNSSIILKAKKRSHDDSDIVVSPQEKVLNELNNFHYKWGKHAFTTPKNKNDKGLNKFWSSVKETSTHLDHMLESNDVPKQSLKVLESEIILKLLDFLPLEYLLPGNQMRCLIGLSVMFFSLPKSSKHPEVIQLAEHIGILLISILEGVRSVWLFDFVHGGLYLKAFVQTLDDLKMKSSDRNSAWIQKLLEHIVELLIRNAEMLKSSEVYLTQLANNISESLCTAKSMCVLLQKLVLQLRRSYLSTICKDIYKNVAFPVCASVLKNMKNGPDQINKDIYAVLISCYTELIEIAISPVFSSSEKDSSKWLRILPNILERASQQILQKNELEEELRSYIQLFCKVCSHHKELSVYLPDNFVNVIWETLSCHWDKKCQQIREQNSVELSDSSKISKFKLLVKNSQLSFHSCPSYLQLDKESISEQRTTITLSASELDILQIISKTASESDLKEIFQSLQAKIENSSRDISVFDPISFQMTLLITKQLVSSAEPNQLLYISPSIQNIFLHLHYTTSQVCGSVNCLFHITVPVLQFFDFILRKVKGKLPKQTVLQCLHACAGINIENMTSEPVLFVQLFSATWNLLYNLITHHHDLLISSSASFLSFVSILLKTVVKAGNQEVLKNHSDDVRQQVETCAQNMDRLLTLTSQNKLEFSKLAPYLVADYVDSVQHITVHPTIKDHLLLGINRLLDICSKDALQMISVNLNHTCREIYTNLIRNYKHYKHYD